MGKPACPFRHKLIALAAAGLMACGFAPAAFADDAQNDSVGAVFVTAQSEGSAEGATPNSILASVLTADGISIVSADVMLDSDAPEPVIGSFTVDGLTFAVNADGGITLVAVSSDVILSVAAESGEVEGSLSIPLSIVYDDVTYPVTAIGPYAFYLSGATQVALPASIASVDDRAFRSSDVERVEVASDNPNIASFDGVLYSADLTSLLLIPEGRAGAVLLPCETEVAEPSKFSHCSLVDAISVEEGGAAFASWDGLLYNSDGTTLLRVPAGATDITIREECTTIAAGAMEGCAKLERINAPSTVTSISPDVFEAVPTVSLPASMLASDDAPTQLTAMVAFSSIEGGFFELDAVDIEVFLPANANASDWKDAGFTLLESEEVDGEPAVASLQDAATYDANPLAYAATNQVRIGYAPDPDNGPAINWIAIQSPNSNVVTYAAGGSNLTLTNLTSHCKPIGQDSYGVYFYNGEKYFTMSNGSYSSSKPYRSNYSCYYVAYYTTTTSNTPIDITSSFSSSATGRDYYLTLGQPRKVTWNANGGELPSDRRWPVGASYVGNGSSYGAPLPTRDGYHFTGWYTAAEGGSLVCGSRNDGGTVASVTANKTLYAHWVKKEYDISFDVDSEPGDADYPGIAVPDEVVTDDSGQVEIEDPKRPGYVFQGWVIPNTDETEAIDQDLVYQGDDGKWYVDASKLPDYATDGKVELTARWTSIISVDVPSAVTFYADVVTQDKDADDNQKSLDGAADNAFGQAKVTSQSQVDLRIVGLESEAAEGDGMNSLGASDVLVDKASASVPASSGWKLFSLFPSSEQLTADDLQDPSRVSAQPEGGVTFDIDDILLEKSFAAEDFTIPAGETLNLGYRLNLKETQQALDYDKLSTLDDGQSVAIANIAYTFASDGHLPSATGSRDDDFYIEHNGTIYGPEDIKASAQCIAEYGEGSPCYALYSSFMESGMNPSDASAAHGYVKWGDGSTYNVRIIGINYDDAVDDSGNPIGKAGLTFEFVSALKSMYPFMSVNKNAEGWGGSTLRATMNSGAIWNQVPSQLKDRLAIARKHYQGGGANYSKSATSDDRLFLPAYAEVMVSADANWGKWWQSLIKERGTMDGPYQYYKQFGLSANTGVPSSLSKSDDTWWYRTAYPGNSTSFVLGTARNAIGYDTSEVGSTFSRHVAPAFCL